MKYLYLELRDFERFSLNNIKLFTMRFDAMLQIILGTNGSGKTSLLEQISPLPPNPKDFGDKGYKKIIIEHNNSNYELLFYNDNGSKFEFIKDGENLNQRRSITVQKELVKKYLNYSSSMHNLLMGKESFTQMSAQRRKDWFIELCETNYDYAVQKFLKVKEKYRDITGAIKQTQKKLIEEKNKSLQEKEITELQNQAKDLYSLISTLMEHRSPVINSQDNYNHSLRSIQDKVYKLLNALQGHTAKNTSVYTKEQLSSLIADLNTRRTQLEAMSAQTSKLIDQTQKNIDLLISADHKSVEQLNSQIQTLEDKINEIDLTTLVDFDKDASSSLEQFSAMHSTLNEISQQIPVKNPNHTQANYTYNCELLTKKQEYYDSLQQQISSCTAKLNHLQQKHNDSDVVCPECAAVFKPNKDAFTIDSYTAKIEKLQKESDTNKEYIRNIKLEIDEYVQYRNIYSQFINTLKALPQLSQYWVLMKQNDIVDKEPHKLFHFFEQIRIDLTKHLSIQQLKAEINNKRQTTDKLLSLGSKDIDLLYEQQANYTKEYNSQMYKLKNCIGLIQTYKSQEYLLDKIQEINASLQSSLVELDSVSQEKIESYRREVLNETIRSLQSELGSKEHLLHQANAQSAVIASYENQLVQLQKQEADYAIAIKVLSPTEGLIAKGLNGFIKVFITQMNQFIEQIWNYPLTIESCTANDDTVDLDYLFPVKVPGRSKPLSDVCEGSKGMLSIFDLSFKVVSMIYTGLYGGALHLDEYGANLDEEHRKLAVQMIESLMDQKSFEQILMVSHYASMYGALSNAQVCVLNNLNICVPRGDVKVNEHVVMS